MIQTSFPDRTLMARQVARMLLEIEAVHFRADPPYMLTSGMASPVYIDCRKLISFPRIRSACMDFACSVLAQDAGFERFDAIAGGETAGIPFAAWIADRLALPMQYVRKKPKGFGRDARIEGEIKEGQRVLLVEDLTTDGGSKLSFVDAIRETGATCSATAQATPMFCSITRTSISPSRPSWISMSSTCCTMTGARPSVGSSITRRRGLSNIARLIASTHPGCDRAPEQIRSCVRYGASARGGQALILLAKARALLRGELHVSVADVEAVAAPALRHRLILNFEGEADRVATDTIIEAALARVPGPRE